MRGDTSEVLWHRPPGGVKVRRGRWCSSKNSEMNVWWPTRVLLLRHRFYINVWGGQKPRTLAVFPLSSCCISSTSSCFSQLRPLEPRPALVGFYNSGNVWPHRAPSSVFWPRHRHRLRVLVFFFFFFGEIGGREKKNGHKAAFRLAISEASGRAAHREEFISAGGLRRCFCGTFCLYLYLFTSRYYFI